MITKDELTKLFIAARDAAIAADPTEDGGTCNFDTPSIRIENARQSMIEEAAKAAGISVTEFTWFKRRWFWVNVPLHGQANRRTKMAQAANDVLKTRPELNAMMYYQMD